MPFGGSWTSVTNFMFLISLFEGDEQRTEEQIETVASLELSPWLQIRHNTSDICEFLNVAFLTFSQFHQCFTCAIFV